jgi:hypothetical protein
MGKRKKNSGKVRLVEIRTTSDWYAKVAAEADRLGLPVSTFIRVAVNDWLDRKASERAVHMQGSLAGGDEAYAQIKMVDPVAGGEGEGQFAKIVFLPSGEAGGAPLQRVGAGRAAQAETQPHRAKARTLK